MILTIRTAFVACGFSFLLLSGCGGPNPEAGPPIPDPDPKTLPSTLEGAQQTEAMKKAAAAQAAAQQK
jgi:hypothetical protein